MSDAVMPEVEYEVWQDGDWVAGSNDRADAEHYLTLYGQDGPVEAKTSFTYRVDGFTDTHALAASTPVGGWEDISTAPKDETRVLIFRPSDFEEDRVFHAQQDAEGYWFIHDGKHDHSLRGDQPTHWMPLPPPPSVSIDNGSRPQEAVPTEQAVLPVVGSYAMHPFDDVVVRIDKIDGGRVSYTTYSPGGFGGCPVSNLRPMPRPQPADDCSSNEGVGQ